MKIAKTISIALVVAIAGLLAYASTRPKTFHVERSIDIKASAAKIFPYLNDFRKGPQWSPWEKTDPQMKRTYSGAETGKGSVYAWAGNKEAGKGRMTILESAENRRVVVALHFDEPMEGDNTVEYLLTPKGDQTKVKWTMAGPMPFFSRVVCIFFDMDKMIGGQFDKGLHSLKILTEK